MLMFNLWYPYNIKNKSVYNYHMRHIQQIPYTMKGSRSKCYDELNWSMLTTVNLAISFCEQLRAGSELPSGLYLK